MDVPAGEQGLTLNIGIASHTENFASPGDLIDAAHVALQESKKAGT